MKNPVNYPEKPLASRLRIIINSQAQHPGQNHGYPTGYENHDGLAVKKYGEDKAQQGGRYNLWYHNKEVEHAHVIAHFFRGQTARENGVWHG